MWSRHGLTTKHERLLRLEETARERKLKLTDEQIELLERFSPEFRERHIEVHYPGDLVAVDTFFVGTLKGVGKVYLQTVLDCFSRYAWGRLYTSKLPLTAVQVMIPVVVWKSAVRSAVTTIVWRMFRRAVRASSSSVLSYTNTRSE